MSIKNSIMIYYDNNGYKFQFDFRRLRSDIVSEDTGSNLLGDHRIRNVCIRRFSCI